MNYARQTLARQTLARKKDSRTARGFTLLELMVVVVIIGVLAALIAPAVLERAEQAKVTAARTDVSNLMNALKLYRLDNGRYPSGEQGLDALVNKPTAGAIPGNWKAYLDKLPADPWQHPYQYANPGVHGDIDVFSFGADGQPGGEGNDADVGSWQ
ncbi:MAG TPA: type II secretion system major pseudopilin GspG [Burkholderiaceae bacterium]|jgi:general secretion pathway protein G|nr:type II secretion system major pseudopilin GspG [Burkholderiaceae bacterium]